MFTNLIFLFLQTTFNHSKACKKSTQIKLIHNCTAGIVLSHWNTFWTIYQTINYCYHDFHTDTMHIFVFGPLLRETTRSAKWYIFIAIGLSRWNSSYNSWIFSLLLSIVFCSTSYILHEYLLYHYFLLFLTAECKYSLIYSIIMSVWVVIVKLSSVIMNHNVSMRD